MNRNKFIKDAGLLSAGILLKDFSFAHANDPFPVARVAYDKRKFNSKAVEAAITEFRAKIK